MASAVLGTLSRYGILIRTGQTLRVSPRFLAHAETTASRMGTHLIAYGPAQALEAALSSWDDYPHDVRPAALFLVQFMADRGQWGGLRTSFPLLEGFGVAA